MRVEIRTAEGWTGRLSTLTSFRYLLRHLFGSRRRNHDSAFIAAHALCGGDGCTYATLPLSHGAEITSVALQHTCAFMATCKGVFSWTRWSTPWVGAHSEKWKN